MNTDATAPSVAAVVAVQIGTEFCETKGLIVERFARDQRSFWVQNSVQNPFTFDQIDVKYGHRWQAEANGCMTQALRLQDFTQHRVAPQK